MRAHDEAEQAAALHAAVYEKRGAHARGPKEHAAAGCAATFSTVPGSVDAEPASRKTAAHMRKNFRNTNGVLSDGAQE